MKVVVPVCVWGGGVGVEEEGKCVCKLQCALGCT